MVSIIVFTGPAGSGKTSLVKAYSEWVRRTLLLRTAVVNLDPGVEEPGYKPVLDIRDFFTLRDVMVKYGLGPNGAFIKSSELIADYMEDILGRPPFSNIEKWDLVVVDTPGQMEAFIFRPASSVFLRRVSRLGNTVLVYLIDSSSIENVTDAVTLWFIYVLLQVKTGLPTIPVISKSDMARNREIVKLLIERPMDLLGMIRDDTGFAGDIIPDLLSIALKTMGPLRAVEVSALNKEGMDKLHVLLHEVFCACGDLT